MKTHKKKGRYMSPRVRISPFVVNLYFPKQDNTEMLSLLTQICYGSCCLLKDTKITLASDMRGLKQYKMIQDIKVGDVVVAKNITSNIQATGKVKKVFKAVIPLYKIVNRKLKISDFHPVWIIGMGWIKVGKLKVGMKMLNDSNKEIVISSISEVVGATEVYNIEVSKHKNYFAEDILVHNKC